MSDQARAVYDRIDLGNAVFLTGFFLPLVVGSVVAIVGLGITDSWWVALAGVANFGILGYFGSQLFGGNGALEKTVWYTGIACFVLALVVAFAGSGSLVACFVATVALMPTVFAALVATGPSRDFLRSKRGEDVVVTEKVARDENLFVAATEGEQISVRDEAQTAASSCALVTKFVAMFLVPVGIGGVALGGWTFWNEGWGISMIIVSLLAIPSGLVLMTLADSWSFLATTKGAEKAHTSHIVRHSKMAMNFALGAALVVLLLMIIEASW